MPYKDPEKQREYARKWIAKRREDYFKDKKCVDCGSTERLELSHLDKESKISHRIWSWSEERRLEEIAKCVIRCKSCHVKADNPESPHGTNRRYHRGCKCKKCMRAARLHRYGYEGYH